VRSTTQYQLSFRDGRLAGVSVLLTGDQTTLGRQPGNDVVVPDPQVSRRHSLLRRWGAGYVITDLGSANGTFVDGARVGQDYPLRLGCTINLGGAATMVFQEVPALPQRAPLSQPAQIRDSANLLAFMVFPTMMGLVFCLVLFLAIIGNIPASTATSSQMWPSPTVLVATATPSAVPTVPGPAPDPIPAQFSPASQNYLRLARLITPRDPAVETLVRVAADYAPFHAMPGYQSVSGYSDQDVTYFQAAAVFAAMTQHYHVTYVAASLDLAAGTQHIHQPAEVLQQRQGTCIETAALVASALERLNMDVYLILVPGQDPHHAFLAVRSWEGADTCYFWETTALTGTPREACDLGAREWQQAAGDAIAVSVRQARVQGIQ